MARTDNTVTRSLLPEPNWDDRLTTAVCCRYHQAGMAPLPVWRTSTCEPLDGLEPPAFALRERRSGLVSYRGTAAGQRLELQFTASGAVVLPLDDPASGACAARDSNPLFPGVRVRCIARHARSAFREATIKASRWEPYRGVEPLCSAWKAGVLPLDQYGAVPLP